jgi:hypothetical protein
MHTGGRRCSLNVVNAKDARRAEFDSLLSEWREALLAAREALRAEEAVLPLEELAAHKHHLRDEYEAVAAELRQFARDEGLSPELVQPLSLGELEVTWPRRVRAAREQRRPPARCQASR